jgi:hypothetical protein
VSRVGDRETILALESQVVELLASLEAYNREMQQSGGGDPSFVKLIELQRKRVGWLLELAGKMEEIIRDMLDRAQNIQIAAKGQFTGKPLS